MKAARITEYGGTSVIKLADIEKLAPAPGQVLIAVKAASINPFDSSVREGRVKNLIKLPVTLGGDFAGTVIAIGAGESDFAAGDNVYGQALILSGNSGAFAEYAAVAVGQAAAMPKNLDFTAAAALPLAGVSALQALTEHIKLQSGQRIFIHGGAGGIGSIAVQIAHNIGAYVAATATGGGIETVRQLGADEIIDHKHQGITPGLHDFDAVFDATGGTDFNATLDILHPGGTAVSMIASADVAKASQLGVTAVTQSTRVTTERLDTLRGLVESGVIKPIVSKVFPLEQITEAFQAAEAGGYSGKIVIQVQPS